MAPTKKRAHTEEPPNQVTDANYVLHKRILQRLDESAAERRASRSDHVLHKRILQRLDETAGERRASQPVSQYTDGSTGPDTVLKMDRQKRRNSKVGENEVSAGDRASERKKRKSREVEDQDEESFDGDVIEVGSGQKRGSDPPKPPKKQRRSEGHNTPRHNRQYAMVVVTPPHRQPQEDLRSLSQNQPRSQHQSSTGTDDDSPDGSGIDPTRQAMAARLGRFQEWPIERRIFGDHRLASLMLRLDARGLNKAAPWAFDRNGKPFEEYEYIKCIAKHVRFVSEETQHKLSLIFG